MNNSQISDSIDLSVKCNGATNGQTHPLVYLTIDKKVGSIECPYCAKIFTLTQKD